MEVKCEIRRFSLLIISLLSLIRADPNVPSAQTAAQPNVMDLPYWEALLAKTMPAMNIPAVCPAKLMDPSNQGGRQWDALIHYIGTLALECAEGKRRGRKMDEIRQEQKQKLFSLLIGMTNGQRQILLKHFCGAQHGLGAHWPLHPVVDKVREIVGYSANCVPNFVAGTGLEPSLRMSPQFHDLLLALLEDPIAYDAKHLFRSLSGKVINADAIFDILLNRTKEQLNMIWRVYDRMYSGTVKSGSGFSAKTKMPSRAKNASGLTLMLSRQAMRGKIVKFIADGTINANVQQICGTNCAQVFEWMAKRVGNTGNGQWQNIYNPTVWGELKNWFTVPYRRYEDYIRHAAFLFQHLPSDDIIYMVVKPRMAADYTLAGLHRNMAENMQKSIPKANQMDFHLQLALLARMWRLLGVYDATPNLRDPIENRQHGDQATRIMANIGAKDYGELTRLLVSHSERDLWNVAYQFQHFHKQYDFQRLVERMKKQLISGTPVSYSRAILVLLYESSEEHGKMWEWEAAQREAAREKALEKVRDEIERRRVEAGNNYLGQNDEFVKKLTKEIANFGNNEGRKLCLKSGLVESVLAQMGLFKKHAYNVLPNQHYFAQNEAFFQAAIPNQSNQQWSPYDTGPNGVKLTHQQWTGPYPQTSINMNQHKYQAISTNMARTQFWQNDHKMAIRQHGPGRQYYFVNPTKRSKFSLTKPSTWFGGKKKRRRQKGGAYMYGKMHRPTFHPNRFENNPYGRVYGGGTFPVYQYGRTQVHPSNGQTTKTGSNSHHSSSSSSSSSSSEEEFDTDGNNPTSPLVVPHHSILLPAPARVERYIRIFGPDSLGFDERNCGIPNAEFNQILTMSKQCQDFFHNFTSSNVDDNSLLNAAVKVMCRTPLYISLRADFKTACEDNGIAIFSEDAKRGCSGLIEAFREKATIGQPSP